MQIQMLIDTEQANKTIYSIISKIEKPDDILRNILVYLMPQIQLHIINQENQDGSKYLPPKAEPTRRALIKTGNYINSFKHRIVGNSIEIYSTHPGVKTHELGLKITNLFGKGIVYQFPKRSAVWLSEIALKKIIPDLILRDLVNA